MVNQLLVRCADAACLVCAQADPTTAARLEPAARARLAAALILLTIGGVALVVLAWLALRIGRRYTDRQDAPLGTHRGSWSQDDWARQRLDQSDE